MNNFLKVGTKQAIFEIRRNNQTICFTFNVLYAQFLANDKENRIYCRLISNL